jgi:hypothetical protein
MSLYIDPLVSRQGVRMRGFFVRNRQRKVLAIGATATASSPGWAMPHAKRYARDVTLCAAIIKLTGVPLKWNLRWDQKQWDQKQRRFCS